MEATKLEQIRAAQAEHMYVMRVRYEIRKKYSIEDEIAILRQKETKPNEYEEWNAYVETVKTNIKSKMKKQ